MNEFVRVGDSGNKPDKNGHGCVPYEYEIARYAITNDDWVSFLNAVGTEKVNAFKLWHKDMSTGILGGIDCVGGVFTAKDGWGKRPLVYVNYLSLLRYCNWLNSGETEHGAYNLEETMPKRLSGSRYFLPTEDEWYKAAYWDGNQYWKYPTQSNDLPRQSEANYEKGDAFAVGAPYYLAEVDNFSDCPSPWGAVQMGGNAWEMMEDCFENPLGNKLRGGSFGYTETGLSSGNTDFGKYNGRCYVFGARIARCIDGWHPCHKPIKYAIILGTKIWLRNCKSFVRRLLLPGRS